VRWKLRAPRPPPCNTRTSTPPSTRQTDPLERLLLSGFSGASERVPPTSRARGRRPPRAPPSQRRPLTPQPPAPHPPNSLDEQIRKLDEQLARFREQLKRAKPGTAPHEAVKRRALGVLRQKRMYEAQRDTLLAQQLNVEQARFAVDSIQDTAQTVQALKGGVEAGKKALGAHRGALDLGAIDRLQDEMAELADLSAEVNEALGRSSYAVPEDVDETDLMAELDALEDDMLAGGEGEGAMEAAGGVPSYLAADDGLGEGAGALDEAELGLPTAPAGQAAAAPAMPT
jgi:charged multivesicular body protein 5